MEVASPSLHLSDELLFEKIKEDDHTAYTLLYNRYKRHLFHYASGFLQDITTTEEIVQDFFLQLWLKRNSIEIRYSLTHYFFKSVRNRIVNHIRNCAAYQKRISLADIYRVVPENEIFERLDRRDREQKINRLIENLSQPYREVYALRIQYNLSNNKTAHILNRSRHTVDKQIRKIAFFLVEKLQEN